MKNCRFIVKASYILTLLISITGCNKEYKSSENSKVETVKSLNMGDNDKVIEKLSLKNKDEDDTFYLASALASKGGLDIYSMYPILEVKLFHESAMNWSDISKEDSNMSIMKKRQNGPSKTKEDREQIWISSEKRLKKRFQIDENIRCASFISYNEFCEEFNSKLSEKVKRDISFLASKNISAANGLNYEDSQALANEVLGFDFYGADRVDDLNWEDHNLINDIFNRVVSYNEKVYEYELAKRKFISPPKLGDLTEADAPLVMMSVLLTTYEAIPLLQSLPQISLKDQDYITQAIDELVKLTRSPKYKRKASTFLYSLSLFSLVSIYSSSFDFEKISSPMDLYCQFKPEVLAENYEVIRARFYTLLKHGKEAFLPKDLLEEFDKYYKQFQNSPKTFDPILKNRFILRTKENQESGCSIDSIL